MTSQDLAALCDGEKFAANNLGLPLTAFLTITWRSAPGFIKGNGPSWSQHQSRLLEKMSKWLQRRGVEVAYLWVRERCVGMGAHTHVLLHIPPQRWKELTPALQGHLNEAGGFTDPRAVFISNSKGSGANSMVSPRQRLGVLMYCSKGINQNEMIPTGAGVVPLSTFLGIRPEQQVPIPCKRVGWSQNIGTKTREAAGYVDIADVLGLAEHLP